MPDGVRIDRRDAADAVTLTVTGVVDVSTAAELRQALTEAQLGAVPRVDANLEGVEFLDSFGLGVLIGAVRRARTHGTEFRIVCSRPRLLQVFAVSRLDEIVPIVGSGRGD